MTSSGGLDVIAQQNEKLGGYDFLVTVLCGLALAYISANGLASSFLNPHVTHRCAVPELEHLGDAYAEMLSIPWDWQDGRYSSCQMYNITWSDYAVGVSDLENVTWWDIPHHNMSTRHCDNGWVYDVTYFTATLTSQWELVCDRKWIVDVVSPLFLAGQFMGSLLCGQVSNRVGRRRGVVTFVCLLAVFGSAAAMSPLVELFIVFRFLAGAAAISITITCFVLLVEVMPTKYRELTCGLYQLFYPVGVLILSLCAYFLRHFRALQFVLALMGLPMIAYLWILPESPTWLNLVGRQEQAVEELTHIWKRNRRTLPTELLRESVEKKLNDPSTAPKTNKSKPGSTMDFVRHPLARKYLIIISVCWSVCAFIYQGVSFNLTGLFGNPYENGVISATMECAAMIAAIVAVQRIGRRRTIMASFAIISVCSFLPIPFQVVEVVPVISTICILVCRAIASSLFLAFFLVSGELFPTYLRQGGIGIANACAFTVAMVSPVICGPAITDHWPWLPNVIYGAASVVCTLLVLLLPETLGVPLPDTLEQLEAMARNVKTAEKNPSNIENNLPRDGVINDAFMDEKICGLVNKSFLEDSFGIIMHDPSMGEKLGYLTGKTFPDELSVRKDVCFRGRLDQGSILVVMADVCPAPYTEITKL